ncbi:hypothetical protein GO491_03900 [Flavobacteriaceae bacterium Ap0902]|nr:hypothetical protein [Flavobacteriaceae bacterium Ap0902]
MMMYLVFIVLIFFGTYLWVNTAKRFNRTWNRFNTIIYQNQKLSKVAGSICLIIAFICLKSIHGLWSSVIITLNCLIIALMVVIIFTPLFQDKK